MDTRRLVLHLVVWSLLMWELGYLAALAIEGKKHGYTPADLKALPPFAVLSLLALTATLAAFITLVACPWLLAYPVPRVLGA